MWGCWKGGGEVDDDGDGIWSGGGDGMTELWGGVLGWR